MVKEPSVTTSCPLIQQYILIAHTTTNKQPVTSEKVP